MAIEYYAIANRFRIKLEYNNVDGTYNYIRKEYKDYHIKNSSLLPTIGVIYQSQTSVDFPFIKELVKDVLYEDEKYIYVRYKDTFLRMKLSYEHFEITYDRDFEGSVAFHYLEVLVRLYAHKYGIDFFHAASFKYNNQVYMLNGFGGSGKTEIMIDFLLRGANYLSDDLVIINEQGELYPYTVSIPIRWESINDKFINKVKIPPYLYKICKYCKRKNGKITRRIYGKLVWKYILGNYSYKKLASNITELRFYSIDKAVWLQEANFEGEFDFSINDFFHYMNLCLENESRKYCDIEGFLQLKFHEVGTLKEAQQNLRKKISKNIKIIGFAVNNRDFPSVTKKLITAK